MAKSEGAWSYIGKSLANFKAALLGYKTYKAFIKQEGNLGPVVTVIENSLDIQITFEYIANGLYHGYINKNIFTSFNTGLGGHKVETFIQPSSIVNGSSTFNPGIAQAVPIFFNTLGIFSWVNGGPSDDQIGVRNSAILEIRVYNK